MGVRRYCIGAVALGFCGCLCLSAGCGGSRTSTPGSGGDTSTQGERANSVTSGKEVKKPSAVTDATEDSEGTPLEGPFGTIDGTVKFVGDDIPPSDVISNTTDPLVCGAQMSKRNKEISAENRGIRYVLVWLEDVKLPDGYKPPRQDLVLDNKNCQFEPHAATITVGSTIEATNSDDVFHTTNLYGVVSENMPLVSKGSSQKTVARRVGTVQVKCDKHGWMQAFIRVNPHPFHGVTDADGKFSIANVPVGTYKLKAWHEDFHGQDSEVTVTADKPSSLEISYPKEEQK